VTKGWVSGILESFIRVKIDAVRGVVTATGFRQTPLFLKQELFAYSGFMAHTVVDRWMIRDAALAGTVVRAGAAGRSVASQSGRNSWSFARPDKVCKWACNIRV
jgi:hypothetical protein